MVVAVFCGLLWERAVGLPPGLSEAAIFRIFKGVSGYDFYGLIQEMTHASEMCWLSTSTTTTTIVTTVFIFVRLLGMFVSSHGLGGHQTAFIFCPFDDSFFSFMQP